MVLTMSYNNLLNPSPSFSIPSSPPCLPTLSLLHHPLPLHPSLPPLPSHSPSSLALPFPFSPSHSPSHLQQQRAKDSQGKLSLDDLLIKPVQRIPRYVLFIKDLLKHTAPSHPDHSPLQQALGELTMLAERVNASERERGRLNQQKELLAAVDGLALVCVCVFVHCSVCMKVGWAE